MFLKRGILSAIHLQNSLFLRPCNQQMVADTEFTAFNQIGRDNFAATEVQPNGMVDCCTLSTIGFVMTPVCVKYY